VRTRSLIACTTLALLAHVGLLAVLGQGGPGRAASPPSMQAHSFFRLVRVADPAQASPERVAQPRPQLAPEPGHPRPSSRAGADKAAVEPMPTAGDASMTRPEGFGVYRPGTALDVPVRARSAPDLSMLSDLPWSGVPLRLRLFIDGNGVVIDTLVLQSAEAQEVLERVRKMFLATSFTVGTENGRPVPSYKDIELNVGVRS